jgi:hypothetical protein
MNYVTNVISNNDTATRQHATWSDALCYLIDLFGADIDVSSAYRQLTADCGLCLLICGVYVTCTRHVN